MLLFVSARTLLRLNSVSELFDCHITFNIPYVILSVMPKLYQLDNNLFKLPGSGSQLDAGFVKVILPEIRPV